MCAFRTNSTTWVRRCLPFMAATVLFDVEVIYIDMRGPSLLPRTTEWKYLSSICIVFVGQDIPECPGTEVWIQRHFSLYEIIAACETIISDTLRNV